EKWDSKQKMAFLINAYNALTVKLILDHYPVKSIKKIGSFFSNPCKLEFFKLLDGKISSLDPIEHVWLRPKYKDYRIHAAVNCASISCPQLRNEAFIAERLEEQLNEQMGLWLQDKNRNEIEIKDKTFRASKIFDWYKDDFQSWGGGIWNVLKKHLKSSKLPQDIDSFEIDYLEYNWDLNEFRN
ncbi:MAG: DUF547 domain-containing protein, partial [Bdellovibrionales bacterium]|nr:DUF547 domain-containing protein [Bdellovibrionales bacterium]